MFRRLRQAPPADPVSMPVDGSAAEVDGDATGGEAPVAVSEPGLSALPVAGITRRRTAAVVTGIVAAWIVIVFARQVSEASAATARAEAVAAGNVAMQTEVATLERELDSIGRQRYVEQQARAYGLGTPKEVAFSLAADAPPLPADAPGSATSRVGAGAADVAPLERWLTVLFGPTD
jgi:cell division protein FtsB